MFCAVRAMNLELFHCLHVIICVCNLAKMIITTEGKALVDTVTDGYDQRLASHYHVKEGVHVKSQTSLHSNTNVYKYRNNNYRPTRWMYKHRRLMMNTHFTNEKVDRKNGNNKVDDDSVLKVNDSVIDKQLDLLLLHYPVTYTKIKRDLSRIRKKSIETYIHNRDISPDIVTRGKRVALPDKYESDDTSEFSEPTTQPRQILDESTRGIKDTKLHKDSVLDLVTKTMRIKSTASTLDTVVPFKKNPFPYQVLRF